MTFAFLTIEYPNPDSEGLVLAWGILTQVHRVSLGGVNQYHREQIKPYVLTTVPPVRVSFNDISNYDNS